MKHQPSAVITAPTRRDFWQHYYQDKLLNEINKVRETRVVSSTGVELHIDVFPQTSKAAPILMLNHGGGGYSGIFAALALAWHQRGYTVVVPDQRAQGRSGGSLGDYTIDEVVQNLVDVADWVRSEYSGKLFIAGGSIGGGLSYYTAAKLASLGRPPSAVQSLNLYDFGDPRTGVRFTRFLILASIPGVARFSLWIFTSLATIWPRLRLPYRPIARFENMLDEHDVSEGFYKLWKKDPNSLRTVTARCMASMLGTPAEIRLEDNSEIPVQVINPKRDKMVNPDLTRSCYQRLSGPKEYLEIDWGHFSLQPEFIEDLVRHGDRWFLQYGAAP